MAMTIDARVIDQTANATSITYSHTISGSDTLLTLKVACFNADGDIITGATYNSTAMTLVDKQLDIDRYCYEFYLINPSSGANNVVVSASTTTNFEANSISFNGADQTTQPNVSAKAVTSSTSTTTMTVTTTRDGCWLTSSMWTNRNQTAGANTTLLGNNNNGVATEGSTVLGTAGSHSLVTTQSDSTSRAYVIAAYQPAVVNLANLKTINTVTKANTKTMDSVVIANVKTANTVV